MLQRIQTVFLAIAAILGVLIFFFPIANFSFCAGSFDMFITGVKNLSPEELEAPIITQFLFTFFFIFMVSLLILISIGTLLLYKKRIIQMKLLRFGIMAGIVYIFLNFMLVDTVYKKLQATAANFYCNAESVVVNYNFFANILPIIILICFFLAFRFINKDEKLVKSADRLR